METIASSWIWGGFMVFVLAMLALDLGVFHRTAHVVTLKESLTWTAVWVALALLFNAGTTPDRRRRWSSSPAT